MFPLPRKYIETFCGCYILGFKVFVSYITQMLNAKKFFFSFLEIFDIAYCFIFVVLFLKVTSMLFHFKGNRNPSCTGPLLYWPSFT